MRLPGVVGVALLAAVAFAPVPVQAFIPKAYAEVPFVNEDVVCNGLPPVPTILRAHAVGGGVLLRWDREVNELLGLPVYEWHVYRVSVQEPIPTGPYAVVGGMDDEFLDPDGNESHFYWVEAHNCSPLSPPSNVASTAIGVIDCAEWRFDPPRILIDHNCGEPPACYTVIYFLPPGSDEWCD